MREDFADDAGPTPSRAGIAFSVNPVIVPTMMGNGVVLLLGLARIRDFPSQSPTRYPYCVRVRCQGLVVLPTPVIEVPYPSRVPVMRPSLTGWDGPARPLLLGYPGVPQWLDVFHGAPVVSKITIDGSYKDSVWR